MSTALTLALFPWATGMRMLGVLVNDGIILVDELTGRADA